MDNLVGTEKYNEKMLQSYVPEITTVNILAYFLLNHEADGSGNKFS